MRTVDLCDEQARTRLKGFAVAARDTMRSEQKTLRSSRRRNALIGGHSPFDVTWHDAVRRQKGPGPRVEGATDSQKHHDFRHRRNAALCGYDEGPIHATMHVGSHCCPTFFSGKTSESSAFSGRNRLGHGAGRSVHVFGPSRPPSFWPHCHLLAKRYRSFVCVSNWPEAVVRLQMLAV